jgi:surface antigen
LAFDAVIGEVAKTAWEDAIEFGRDTSKDPVLTELEGILQGRVGVPMDEAEYQKALAEAKVRAETKRPPGYMDARKNTPGGDYLTWAEVLEGAENLRHLGKGPAERGGAFGMRRAGLGPIGGGMIFGLWA